MKVKTAAKTQLKVY